MSIYFYLFPVGVDIKKFEYPVQLFECVILYLYIAALFLRADSHLGTEYVLQLFFKAFCLVIHCRWFGRGLPALPPACLYRAARGEVFALTNGEAFFDNERRKHHLFRLLLETRQRVLDKEHHDTLTAMNDLGACLYQQGRFAEAEKLHRQVLEIRQRVLGKEHANTLWSLGWVATCLGSQGKHAESERLYREVLETAHAVTKKDPDTLELVMTIPARHLQGETESDQLELFWRLTLEIRRRVFGKEEVDTRRSMKSLADVLSAQGKDKEAKEIRKELREMSKNGGR